MELPQAVDAVLAAAANDDRPLVFLTGAGISAESGIPTFRGPGGFWTVGSTVHRPEELATAAFFESHPESQWPWYLWRRAACLSARPNPAHEALVRLERAFADRFILITQNVDGLHRRAGQSPERTYQIHGDIHRMRCSKPCSLEIRDLPESYASWEKDRPLAAPDVRALHCPSCGAWMRPHVLWFDESYDELWFRFESAITAAKCAGLLVVVGSTGTTNLPQQIARIAASRGIPMIDVNPEENAFARLAETSGRGGAIRATAGAGVPAIVERLIGHRKT